MKFETFELERNQSLFENEVDYNLSESGVHPMKMSEILTDDEQRELLNKYENAKRKLFETPCVLNINM